MKLFQKDGITVQALSPREEAEYKKLGFSEVKEPEKAPAEKAPAEKVSKPKPEKAPAADKKAGE